MALLTDKQAGQIQRRFYPGLVTVSEVLNAKCRSDIEKCCLHGRDKT